MVSCTVEDKLWTSFHWLSFTMIDDDGFIPCGSGYQVKLGQLHVRGNVDSSACCPLVGQV